MAVIGTFGSYTAARLAIYSSQAAMNVTGNNIGNINTTGYTRQRTDQCSMYSVGTPRYQNSYNINIGYGAIVDNVSQLRDPYLDIRYRNENASLGYYEAMQEGMGQLGHILDEVGKGQEDFGIIENQQGGLKNALRDLLQFPDSTQHDDLVNAAASTLCSLLNSAAKELNQIKVSEEARMTEAVKEINSILSNIRDLNEQIRTQSVYGGNALELRDARNVQIDKLSKYVKIDVTYSIEKLDGGTEIEKLSISLAGTQDPNKGPSTVTQPIMLVDGIYATQFELSGLRDEKVDPATGKVTSTTLYGIQKKDAAGNYYLEEVTYPATATDTTDAKGKVLAMNPNYDPNYTGGTDKSKMCAYLDANGDPTDDIKLAALINSSVDGASDNQYIFSLTALKDKTGRILNDGAKNGTKSQPVQLGDNDLYGSLQAMRELLTEDGEFASVMDVALDPDAATKRGIPFYQHMLDSLAQQMAKMFNDANFLPAESARNAYKTNANGEFLAADGTVIQTVDGNNVPMKAEHLTYRTELDPSDPNYLNPADESEANKKKIAEDKALVDANLRRLWENGVVKTDSPEWNFYDGGVLFSNSGNTDDPTNITALNISVSHSWSEGTVRVLNTTQPNTQYIDEDGTLKYTDNKTLNDNLAHIMSMMDQKLDYIAKDTVPDAVDTGKAFFNGSFQEMFGRGPALLGADSQTNNGLYSNYSITTLSLDNDRISVSGVDLNEEATNMMQYSQSFSAACRLLTAIDEMLDTLINNTLR